MATNTNTEKKIEATEEKVKIRLPLTRTETDDVFVAVNGRTWLIKRGVEVEVPPCVVEVLRNQEEALRKAYDFQAAAESK